MFLLQVYYAKTSQTFCFRQHDTAKDIKDKIALAMRDFYVNPEESLRVIEFEDSFGHECTLDIASVCSTVLADVEKDKQAAREVQQSHGQIIAASPAAGGHPRLVT